MRQDSGPDAFSTLKVEDSMRALLLASDAIFIPTKTERYTMQSD